MCYQPPPTPARLTKMTDLNHYAQRGWKKSTNLIDGLNFPCCCTPLEESCEKQMKVQNPLDLRIWSLPPATWHKARDG